MTLKTDKRRRSERFAIYAAMILRAADREVVARGQALNMSANGLFVVTTEPADVPVNEQVIVELSQPQPNGQAGRQVTEYHCRVVRRVQMGHLTGMGMEFATPAD